MTAPLNFLAHRLDFQDETLTVMDFGGQQTGFLKVDIVPCDRKGNENCDLCVNDPMDLVSNILLFSLTLLLQQLLPCTYGHQHSISNHKTLISISTHCNLLAHIVI